MCISLSHFCHSHESGNPVISLMSLSILGLELRMEKRGHFIYYEVYSRFPCFCLGVLWIPAGVYPRPPSGAGMTTRGGCKQLHPPDLTSYIIHENMHLSYFTISFKHSLCQRRKTRYSKLHWQKCAHRNGLGVCKSQKNIFSKQYAIGFDLYGRD